MINKWVAGIVCLVASGVAGLAQGPKPSNAPAQQRPVFRAGAHYVSVDAYPSREGRVIEGLTKADFEIFEDGKPQQVDAAEFVSSDAKLADDERPALLSQREALELASDARYRVFIIVIDRAAVEMWGWPLMRPAIHQFFDRNVTPRDLVAITTTDSSWHDVVLGRRPSVIEAEIDDPNWIKAQPSEQATVLLGCGVDPRRVRSDETYTMLEGLISLVSQVREARTSIVFVSTGISHMRSDRNAGNQRPLTLPPRIGVNNGTIQRLPRATDLHDNYCRYELGRMADMDYEQRYRSLIESARASNVSFYPVLVAVPVPLDPSGAGFRRVDDYGRPLGPFRGYVRPPADSLAALAGDSGGVLAPAVGDLRGAIGAAMTDAGSHYLLGYYTTNTKWDGKIRKITVRMKPQGNVIRARKEYRAPTKDEIESLSSPHAPGVPARSAAVANALSALSAIRPSAQFYAYGAVAGQMMTVTIEVPEVAVEAGRWSDGASLELIADTASGDTAGMARGRLLPNGRATVELPLDAGMTPSNLFVRLRADGEAVTERVAVGHDPSTLAGDPLVYRSNGRALAVPVASFQFTHDDRIKLDWSILAPIDRYELHLLDLFGRPLSAKIDLQDAGGTAGRHLVTEFPLSSLGRGDYVIELAVHRGEAIERKLTAIRVR
jgi:VWFA-related protein